MFYTRLLLAFLICLLVLVFGTFCLCWFSWCGSFPFEIWPKFWIALSLVNLNPLESRSYGVSSLGGMVKLSFLFWFETESHSLVRINPVSLLRASDLYSEIAASEVSYPQIVESSMMELSEWSLLQLQVVTLWMSNLSPIHELCILNPCAWVPVCTMTLIHDAH